MTSRLSLFTAALLAASLFPAPSFAQHHGGSPGHSSRISPVLTGRGHAAHRGRHGGFFYPYYWDSDYGPDTSDGPQEPPVTPVNVSVQTAQPPAPAPQPADSLLLEYHDGQWVRIATGSHVPVGPQYTASQQSAATPKNSAAKDTSISPAKLPPAVLVFRDGHEEQVTRYVVQGNVLSTSADYWRTGSWSRKIPISELDVPATVKLNAERGSTFTLPTRPTEIVVRF
jgi:hypothetical protein